MMRPAPAPAPAAEPASRPRTVRLVVLPEGATVEVDGAPAASKDGVVDITGALGSVHEVRISSGGERTTGEVVVTEGGALPPKIQLDAKAAPPPQVAPPTPPAPR
jgi:serine/threonine-protein kinase